MFKLLDYMEYNSSEAIKSAYIGNGNYPTGLIALFHFDGSGQNIVDVMGHTVSVQAQATQVQDVKKIGIGSLYLPTTPSSSIYCTHNDFIIGTQDFEFGGWIRFHTSSGNYTTCLSLGDMKVSMDNGTLPKTMYVHTGESQLITSGKIMNLNTWYYVTLSRQSGTLRFFIDGQLIGQVSNSTNLTANVFYVGRRSQGYYWLGYLDEVYAIIGQAIHTESFTPPETPIGKSIDCDSESSIKTQGSYSLKGIALTNTTQKTLIREINPSIDLTGISEVKFDIRSSRTGANLNISLDQGVDSIVNQEWLTQPYQTLNTVVNKVDGVLNVTSTSIDPFIEMYSLGSFDPHIFKWINIRYRFVSGDTDRFEIFFLNKQHPTAHPDNYIPKLIQHNDNLWHVAAIPAFEHPNWYLSNITGWRFDWSINNNVTMEIDYVRLSRFAQPEIEITPNILEANKWQEVKYSLRHIPNNFKNIIDRLRISVVNSDEPNEFYIDSLFGYTLPKIIIV